MQVQTIATNGAPRPNTSGHSSASSKAGCTVATTTAIWMMVAAVDGTAPATAAVICGGCCCARVPMAWMVAVLETKPAANPASGKPGLAHPDRVARKTGLEIMQAMLAGELPFPHIAETRIAGPDGKPYAHATTTCLLFELPPPRQTAPRQ